MKNLSMRKTESDNPRMAQPKAGCIQQQPSAAQSSALDSKSRGGASVPQVHEGLAPTPALRAWFGRSKVVNPDGSPKVVYHGTASIFSVYSEKASNHFIDSPVVASLYAQANYLEPSRVRNGSTVLPVFLRIEYPLDLRTEPFPDWLDEETVFSPERLIKLIPRLESEGYDGIVVGHQLTMGGPLCGTEYIPFHCDQIKSAIGNNGAFDSRNPDLCC